MLVQSEETSIGLASGRGGAEKGPGHGKGEEEDGDPASILAGSAESIRIYARLRFLVDWKHDQPECTQHAAMPTSDQSP